MSSRGAELTGKQSWIEHEYAASLSNAQGVIRATSESIRSLCLLPSFFVIGPPRTGTTWLYEILRDRAVLPAHTKETRFFDTHFHRGIDWYRSHFPGSPTLRRIGEIAPTYFASTEALQRIASLLPHAKVVCVFRNPAERLLSLYRLKRAYGLIPWTFEQAMVKDPEMVESSRYATRLKTWQRALGKGQVMAAIYEDLRNDPQSFIDRVVDFIGIPRFQLTESEAGRVHSSEVMTHPRSYQRTRRATLMADWCKARKLDKLVAAVRNSPIRRLFLGGGPSFSELPREVVVGLYKLFRPEVEELERMLNRNLSAWKSIDEQRPDEACALSLTGATNLVTP